MNRATHFVKLIGAHPHGIPPEFTNSRAICEFLRHRTWLGSEDYRDSSLAVSFSVLTKEWQISARSLHEDEERPELVWDGSANGHHVRLWTAKGNQRNIRHSVFGGIQVPFQTRTAIAASLTKAGLASFTFELIDRHQVDWGVLGTTTMPPKQASKLEGSLDALLESDEVQACAERRRVSRRIEAMKRLNERMDAARNAKSVFLNDVFIGLEPKSEAGAIALFHKLEGMNALPFEYCSRAWAGAEGIDELADFQLDNLSLKQTDVPVEFEFDLHNFFLHDHPLEQVKLIICWTSSWKREELASTEKPWLFTLQRDGHKIPVVTISSLPGISLSSGVVK
ncbi:hypothetical protein ACOCJ4_13780 [Knoellia sp. CPCC 206435]|uniref:hypothetical protein n=1 Tax=Knoellia terrae TaxID=3404797 RepID=UPI003B42EB9E